MKCLPRESVHSLRTYEPGKPLDEVARDLGLEDASSLVKLASNENALGPSPLAMQAMQSSIHDMHIYPDGSGYYLRKAIAEENALTLDQIILGNGSNELIELIGHAFLDESGGIVVADRAFVVYRLVAALFGAETIDVPMADFRHDLNAMAEAIREDTRVVFISNPNNPTGTMVEESEILGFMERVPDHVLVVVDEAYLELIPEGKVPRLAPSLSDFHNLCLLRTFSKTYGLAGLRIGYALGHPQLVESLNKVRQPFNVNAMAQSAALAALGDRDHVAKTAKLVRAGAAFFTRSLAGLGIESVSSVTNFILVKTGEGRRVFQDLQKRGVIVRPMDGYGLPDHIRITIGTESENQKCLQELRSVLGQRQDFIDG